MDWLQKSADELPHRWKWLGPLLVGLTVVERMVDLGRYISAIQWWYIPAFGVFGTGWVCLYVFFKKTREGVTLACSGEPNVVPAFRPRDKVWAVVFFAIAMAVLVVFFFVRSPHQNDVRSGGGAHAIETPRAPGGLPSLDEVAEVPTRDQVDAQPSVPARTVSLMYKNSSGVELRLLLYDWYYHYHPIDEPLAPQSAWRTWDFPANGVFSTFSGFERSTGWYSFFVEDVDSGRHYWLGTKNIFYAERPTLTVTSRSDNSQPYGVDFGREE